MAKLKTKLLIVAVLGVVLAVFYPKIKKVYGKHVKPHADIAANILRVIKDFHIFGYHVPWKYVLPGFGLFLAVQLFRVSIISFLFHLSSWKRCAFVCHVKTLLRNCHYKNLSQFFLWTALSPSECKKYIYNNFFFISNEISPLTSINMAFSRLDKNNYFNAVAFIFNNSFEDIVSYAENLVIVAFLYKRKNKIM